MPGPGGSHNPRSMFRPHVATKVYVPNSTVNTALSDAVLSPSSTLYTVSPYTDEPAVFSA